MSELIEQVSEKAELAVEQFQDRAGGRLDYSIQSLSIVEEMLSEASDYLDELPQDQIQAITRLFGCYILEVARREFGGQYFWHDQRDQPILVVGEPQYHIALITWDKVGSRLSGDVADNIPFFFNGFAERISRAISGDKVVFV